MEEMPIIIWVSMNFKSVPWTKKGSPLQQGTAAPFSITKEVPETCTGRWEEKE